MYLLQFSDDTENYATKIEATIDCPIILSKYKRENMNKENKTTKKATNNNKISTEEYVCSHTHDDIETFNQEPDSKYFDYGQSMYSATCLECGINIVHTCKTGEFKPSIKLPAYTCIHRTSGCYKTLCNKCAKLLMLSPKQKRSSRRSRHT